MPERIPISISLLFIAITLMAVYFFFKADHRSKPTFVILLAWLALQAVVSNNGFYKITSTTPPRIALAIIPPLLTIILLFATARGRSYLDSLIPQWLTWLHIVRIPVEVGLFFLFAYKLVPQAMTFEGRNFDIFSGATAPFVVYLGYVKKSLSKTILLLWNFVCLALVLNVVIYGLLSAPSVIQQLSFDQPNIAVLYFPIVWLPCCIVPLVILSHMVCIRQLVKNN